MNDLHSLMLNLDGYSHDTKIKIVVDDKEQDIRCIIFDKDKNTIYLADACYDS